MSQYSIGPRIGIEGEAQFRHQISRINSEYRSMDSYLKAVEQSMEKQGRTQSLLESRSAGLQQQITIQGRKWEELNSVLSRVKEQFGEGSQEFVRISGAMLDVENTLADLEQSLLDTDEELERLISGAGELTAQFEDLGDSSREVERVTGSLDDLGDSADGAGAQVLSFGDIVKGGIASGAILSTLERVGEMIVDIGGQAIEAAADVKAANAQFEQTFGELEGRATSALESISDKTGVAVTRLQGGYTALYAFTRSVGGDQETSLNIAQRALTAAADSAAYYDRTMEDATETLQSFLKGNYANDAALGIAATETTRNAKANELYAKSFKELSEAQKVDTLLAMVEAGNAASGALGQAAREADSWANVTGELSEAWRQLLAQLGGPILAGVTPIVQGITNAMNGWMEQSAAEKLSKGIADFRAELEIAEEALENSATTMGATASLAQRYVDRLRDLEDAGLDTADAQREYAQTVELLNALIPELGLTISDVTGRLEQNTGAIAENIQILRRQAEQQAKMAFYKDIIDAYTKAYEEQYAAEQRMLQLQAEELEIRQQLTLAEGMQRAANIRGSANLTAMTERVIDYTNALNDNLAEQHDLGVVLNEASVALAEQESQLAAAEAGYAELAGATREATAAVGEQSDAAASLAEAYKTAKDAARDSINSQIGLFDELATKNEWSAKKIIENWEKQQKAFNNYGDNLKKAVDMGLDEALVQQLSDGSQQSMMILDALVNDSKISVGEINAAFGGLNESKEIVSGVMANVKESFGLSMREILIQARSMGKDTGLGIARGVEDSIPEVESAWVKLAKRGQGAYLHTYDQHSPSRLMRSKGKDSGLGAALGVKDAIPDFERAWTEFADAGTHTYVQQQLDAVAQYPSMMQGVPGYGTTTDNSRTVSLGGVTVNVYTQPGQDGNAVYEQFMARLTHELETGGAAL